MCNKCNNETISNARINNNNNDGDDEISRLREQLGGTMKYNTTINKRNIALKNQGYIDSKKHEDCVRILTINPRGIGPDNQEKINMLKQAMVDYEIDMVLFSGTDRRWNESRIETMKSMMRSVNKSVDIIASDSGEDTRSIGGYLPGGTMSIVTGRLAGMINKDKIKKDKLGRWNSVRFQSGKNTMQIITVYRIPESTQPGILKSRAQYDRVTREVKTSKQYRDELLKELSDEISLLREEGIEGIIIAGDINQDITHIQIQKFMQENGLFEIHQELTNEEETTRDRTYKNGSKQIDAVLGTEAIVRVAQGSKIVDFDEIIITDHRGFLIDLDVNEYFNLPASIYDHSTSRKLNPGNRIHRQQFLETLEECINQTKLMEKTTTICNGRATVEEMNVLDELITYVLTVARKRVEGIARNVPYSKTKQVKWSSIKYIKALINKLKGKQIDETALQRRKEYCELELEDLNIPALEDRHTKAVEEWETFKIETKEKKEEQHLQLYPVEIVGDDDIAQKKRKKAIKSVKQAQYRQRTFNCLSRKVGKGERQSLKRVRIINEDGDVEKELQDRESIEHEIAKYNVKHFRQAFDSKAYKDKIYNKLSINAVRDRILNGELEIDECDDEDVYNMLQLLKKSGERDQQSVLEEISEAEWERVVRQSKRKSASSIFSQRTYSVYKCALESKVMTKIFVLFYNTLIKKGFYLKRWLQVLDVILEKGKGPVIGKLRTIQLIEADLQLLMRIYIGGRNNENIERDERLSKFNYGSRANYSIETAILEKRLMYDVAVRDGKPMLHNISDLKACYDRQLPNLGCMIEEAVGVNRDASKIFAAVLPIMKHHVCIDFGISKTAYGNSREKLGGTGQGNSVSGAICRDTSCLIFKYLEQKNLGALIAHPISRSIIQRIAIAFVDDTDFYTNGPNFEIKMQLIMDLYTKLYEATGGKIQQTKIMFYCWRWIYENGNQKIIQLEANIEVHGERIKSIDVNTSTRTLGVHLTPALSWKGQFEVMRKKMSLSITKIMNMEINPYQAHLYFNVYMIRSVFFGCGVIELDPKEENELKRIYEEPMLVKLGLSKKFPRIVLYKRKSALGIGLLQPSTIIAMLKLKSYIGNKRKKGNATDSINIQEEYQEIEAGRRVNLGENPQLRYWKKTWIDEINDELWKRKMTLTNFEENELKRTKNKTLMQYATEYVEKTNQKIEILKQINFVRMKKGILLPCEVVGAKGRMITESYTNINEMSPMQWNFEKIIEEPISKYQERVWNEFLRWMRSQNVVTIWDFTVDWRWKMSDDESIVVIKDGNDESKYKRINSRGHKYVKDDNAMLNEPFKGCIGRINSDNSLTIISIEDKTVEENTTYQTSTALPDQILNEVRNGTAVAATDAAMVGKYLATHWIISTKKNEIDITGGVESTRWNDGLIPAGEGIGLLDLIKYIKAATCDINQGAICVYNDNKKLLQSISKEVQKESQCTQEAGAVVSAIKQEIESARIQITLEYANDKPNPHKQFEQQQGSVLMKICDEKAKQKCRTLIDGNERCTIKYKGIATPIVEDEIIDKNVNVLVREIDAKQCELISVKERVKEGWEWVDLEARNCFNSGVGATTLKCVYGYNHHGERNGKINKGLVQTTCPRCGEEEDWEHIILCQSISNLKDQYVSELKAKLEKETTNENDKVEIGMIVDDIRNYVMKEQNEYATTQHVIGMDLLFKGWVVKNWLNVNNKQRHVMKRINKIIVKQSVIYYSKAWKNRNDVLHDTEKYREHVIEWHKRLVENIENSNKPSMRRYVRMQKLDLSKCDTGYIRLWNMTTVKMMKNAKEESVNDIRNYFQVR